MALCDTKLRRRQPRRQGPAPIETGSSSAKATAKIVGLFLAGLALAAGHHLFNTRLHGTTVETALGSLAAIREGSFRQADALRIGSAFGEKAAATPLFSTITDTCFDSDYLEDTPRCRNWVRARPERLAHRAVDDDDRRGRRRDLFHHDRHVRLPHLGPVEIVSPSRRTFRCVLVVADRGGPHPIELNDAPGCQNHGLDGSSAPFRCVRNEAVQL